MAIVTATEVTIFTDISVSAGTIIASGIIPIVQERINLITNNYFTTDMQIQGNVVFSSTAKTVVSGGDFEDEGFIAGDEIHIYNSYRNDGYRLVDSVLTDTITFASSETVYSEPSGRTVLVSVVKWPDSIKYIAAQMVKYDYDDRPNVIPGVNAMSLGPYSVQYGTAGFNPQPFGYPLHLIEALNAYTIVRIN
jgi:hypothetical protein